LIRALWQLFLLPFSLLAMGQGNQMPSDFREQLVAALPEHDHKLLFYALGRKHPAYNELGVTETFAKFTEEFLPLCPLEDPLGRDIKVTPINFRKLINLKHKTLGDDAKAWKIVEEIEQGTFDIANYELPDDRIRTLFWVPDAITDPDAIYKNNHCSVQADEVFVSVYDKMGSTVKLTFISTFGKKPVQRVEIVTSYLTEPHTAIKCIKGKPIYVRSK
jgi:hypothetical protein